MKVIQMITGLTMGGAEKVVVDLCAKSKEDGLHMFYVISLSDKLDRKPDLDAIGIPVISLGISRDGKQFFKAVSQVRRFIRENNIDLIHAHMTHAYFMALLSTLGSSVPVIFTPHNTNFGSKLREYFIWATKWRRSYDIIFAQDQKRYFHKAGYRTRVIPNGISVEVFTKRQKAIPKNEIFTFINIGNLEKQKNQIALIDFAVELQKDKRSFQILIVGEGSKEEELQNAIKVKGVENRVFLLGKRKDIPELMAAAHCYLLPSLWEGMPITILEAGISQLPIISTPAGNIPQLLKDDRGILSSLKEFSYQMIWVMDHYSESIENSKKLFILVKNKYSSQSMYLNHIALYEQI